MDPTAKRAQLRIYADFNAGGSPEAGPCWLLRYGPDRQPLDDVAEELGLQDGMPVALFYEDPGEEFEVQGHLVEDAQSNIKWMALPVWDTYRLIRYDPEVR